MDPEPYADFIAQYDMNKDGDVSGYELPFEMRINVLMRVSS